jgi:hypothetical protein
MEVWLLSLINGKMLPCVYSLTNYCGSSYRQILAFGSTIRAWSSNASEMKKLAACDFEDLLQVLQDWSELFYSRL